MKTKVRLIRQDSNWIQPLIEAESHPYFKGSANFLIPDDEELESFKRT